MLALLRARPSSEQEAQALGLFRMRHYEGSAWYGFQLGGKKRRKVAVQKDGEVKRFKTIVGNQGKNDDEFDRLVNDWLAHGWELYGTPFVHNGHLCQAVVREE